MENRSVKIGRSIMLAIMGHPELLYIAKNHIKPEDFIKGIDTDCWNKIVALDGKGEKYDLYTVCNPEYADSIPGDKVGEWDYDEFLQDCTLPFFEDRIVDYVNLVDRERSAARLSNLAKKALDGNLKSSQEIAESINELSQQVYKMHPRQAAGYAGAHILEDLKELSDIGKSAVKFGIQSIDRQLSMNRGQFVLLAARPGTGKSSLFLYPLYEHCKAGKHVCINTMEMTRPEVMLRIIANRSNVMMDKITGKESASIDDGEKISRAIDEIKKWKLTIIDQGMDKTSSIDSFLTRSAAEHNPVAMLVLDHFGLLLPDSGKSSSRYDNYTPISNELKRQAKKHHCVTLCLTQLNRIGDFIKPSKENMRDTGSLEQDADKIIAMWRDASDTRIVNVGAIKNRQGVEFDTKLKFYGSSMQFYET